MREYLLNSEFIHDVPLEMPGYKSLLSETYGPVPLHLLSLPSEQVELSEKETAFERKEKMK